MNICTWERMQKERRQKDQAAAELEGLDAIRNEYMILCSDIEMQINLSYQPEKKRRLQEQLIRLEEKLYRLDAQRMKLWDLAFA